jgi:hypothetical protein
MSAFDPKLTSASILWCSSEAKPVEAISVPKASWTLGWTRGGENFLGARERAEFAASDCSGFSYTSFFSFRHCAKKNVTRREAGHDVLRTATSRPLIDP